MNLPHVTIYTDGACSGNPGPGGWGAYLIYLDANKKEVTKNLSGYEEYTTNNKMEITAAIQGLASLKTKCNVDIYTDSIYVKNGITIWIHNWIKNQWRKKHNVEVKNIDLWQKLHELAAKHNINWHWVKGHGNNRGNIIADELAVYARKQAEVIYANK
jgi:ribonuclease HI